MSDRYADADPDKGVNMGGPKMTLRQAVRGYIEASKKPGYRVPMVYREQGKSPNRLTGGNLNHLASMERFR